MTTKKEIWKLIACSSSVEEADQRTDEVLNEYIRRFESFTKLNIPKWHDLLSGCVFEGIKTRAYEERDGAMLVFTNGMTHTFYLPNKFPETPEAYWNENATEFLDSCMEIMEL